MDGLWDCPPCPPDEEARSALAAAGGGVIGLPGQDAAAGAAGTAILACLRVIDAHLGCGAGLASLGGKRAELLARLEAPTCPASLAGEAWLRLGVLALLGEAEIARAADAAHKGLNLAVAEDASSRQLVCLALLGIADALAGRAVRAVSAFAGAGDEPGAVRGRG